MRLSKQTPHATLVTPVNVRVELFISLELLPANRGGTAPAVFVEAVREQADAGPRVLPLLCYRAPGRL